MPEQRRSAEALCFFSAAKTEALQELLTKTEGLSRATLRRDRGPPSAAEGRRRAPTNTKRDQACSGRSVCTASGMVICMIALFSPGLPFSTRHQP